MRKENPIHLVMKATSTSLSILLTAGFPASLLAEFLGFPPPTALSPATTFGVAVTVFTLLTVFAEYGRTSAHPRARMGAKSSAILGTEERRLAA